MAQQQNVYSSGEQQKVNSSGDKPILTGVGKLPPRVSSFMVDSSFAGSADSFINVGTDTQTETQTTPLLDQPKDSFFQNFKKNWLPFLSAPIYSVANTASYVTHIIDRVQGMDPLELRNVMFGVIGFLSIPTLETNVRNSLEALLDYHSPDLKLKYPITNECIKEVSNLLSAGLKTGGSYMSLSSLLKKFPFLSDLGPGSHYTILGSTVYANLLSTLACFKLGRKQPETSARQAQDIYQSLREVDEVKEGFSSSYFEKIKSGLKRGNCIVSNAVCSMANILFFYNSISSGIDSLTQGKETGNQEIILHSIALFLATLSFPANYRSNEAALKKLHGFSDDLSPPGLIGTISSYTYGMLKSIGSASFLWNLIQKFDQVPEDPYANAGIALLLTLSALGTMDQSLASVHRGIKYKTAGDELYQSTVAPQPMDTNESNDKYFENSLIPTFHEIGSINSAPSRI